jgi:phage shock protein A
MSALDDLDQFQILEDKIDGLIKLVADLRAEKESLAEKVHILEEKLANTSEQLEGLKAARERAKQRVIGLLDKIERIGK